MYLRTTVWSKSDKQSMKSSPMYTWAVSWAEAHLGLTGCELGYVLDWSPVNHILQWQTSRHTYEQQWFSTVGSRLLNYSRNQWNNQKDRFYKYLFVATLADKQRISLTCICCGRTCNKLHTARTKARIRTPGTVRQPPLQPNSNKQCFIE